ncbi:MAG TPA: hypothetical protein PLP07_05060 [Pyrinomonadaceae bacterium]|nr:hypothetical protein [Chloracidobacterium sp.]MBP9934895.1 hypothetical protein [Pyrinomonadaceae bacterium]MBK7803323.1 hypothetical protein [Chloracidobacterium sp.]MBK9438573.1 hypothetical protein [Chloracidobacterium sp.]MBK9766620.1 hypothetical protein [Chloracidobacterium sp.]
MIKATIKKFIAACWMIGMLIAGVPAFETDQYNLPPTPLADIGEEVNGYVSDAISKAVTNLNAKIEAAEACLNATNTRRNGCRSIETERKALAQLRTNDAAAGAVYKLLGDGIFPLSHIGSWLKSHKFSGQPARYTTSFPDSIWATLPTNYLTISPTIRMYGIEFGIDKIEHLFQQGYSYYKIYSRQIAKGATPRAATQKAVSWGQLTERTYYGFLVSGVFSNADLYGNYVGMRFYQGLTEKLQIGESSRPSTLTLDNGRWKFNSEIDEANLLRPFITDHLNEALNPSGFSAIVFPYVRKAVRQRACAQWKTAFPEYTRDGLNTRSNNLRQWNGENYGFTAKKRMISMGDLCYGD